MAYSTNNTSSVVSVTNFGVKLDGVTDNRANLQGAIETLYTKGGGTLRFPPGVCYWSGSLYITGKNISLKGEDGSILTGPPDEQIKKIHISGAKYVSMEGLTCDANRTGTSHSSNQLGFVSTSYSSNTTIENCKFFNTRNSMIYLGGGTQYVNISNNFFTGYFCGVYSTTSAGEEGTSSYFNITNNVFGQTDAWSSGVGESAAIKLQAHYSYTGFQVGHNITNNHIDSSVLMGIELWSRGRDSIVSENNITNTIWGISLDHQKNTLVSNNVIKGVQYIGIEAATLCENCVFDGNVVNGFHGTGNTDPFRYTEGGFSSSNQKNTNLVFSNNVVLGCHAGLSISSNNRVNIDGNSFSDNGINLILKNSSHLVVSNNIIAQDNASVSTHIFMDSVDANITGVYINGNYFYGTLGYAGIVYYSPAAPQIYNSLIQNNFIDTNSSGFYGFVKFDASPKNTLHQNNFTASGATSYNSIENYSSLPAGSLAYGTENIQNGFQYYDSSSYTVPSGGITGDGVWLCIWSGGGGVQNNVRAVISNSLVIDNNYSEIELFANMIPYTGYYSKHTLAATPVTISNADPIYKEAKTLSHDSSAITNSLWVKIGATSTGAAGGTVDIKYSQQNLLSQVYSTYLEPADTDQNAKLVFSQSTNQAQKFSNGISVDQYGSTRIYSASSGSLSAIGNLGLGTSSPTNTLQVDGNGLRVNGEFDETTTNPGVYLGRESSDNTPRALFANGTAAENWQIDNNAGTFRWYLPGVEHMKLSSTALELPSKSIAGNELGADPSAPAANGFKLYAKDNGAGKTALYVLFASGPAQLIATQP